MILPEETGLLLIDIQEKLFPLIHRHSDLIKPIQKTIQAFQLLKRPIFVSEQYPQGLGKTIPALKEELEIHQIYNEKLTFSAFAETTIKEKILALPITYWVIVGIETHICVQQTAKQLQAAGKYPIILADGTSSRTIFDHEIAIKEMQSSAIRISSSEAILFELIKSSSHPDFKEMLQLVKKFS